MSKPRRRHTAEQKAELLRQHVAEKKPGSEVCNEAEIQPSLFYTWQRELLAGAHTVFSTRRAPSRENELEAKISRLEARVARKDQIIAEVTHSHQRKPEKRLMVGGLPVMKHVSRVRSTDCDSRPQQFIPIRSETSRMRDRSTWEIAACIRNFEFISIDAHHSAISISRAAAGARASWRRVSRRRWRVVSESARLASSRSQSAISSSTLATMRCCSVRGGMPKDRLSKIV